MKNATTLLFALGLGTTFACGGSGGSMNDDELAELGFATPTEATTAYKEVSEGVWEEEGPANWSCLNTANDEVATTEDVTLRGSVLDFQTDEPLPGAAITLYGDEGITGSELGSTEADEEGHYELELPAGGTHWAFKMVVEDALDTYSLNQYFEPDQGEQEHSLESVSLLTAQALPAFIGVTRTPGLGIIAGSIRDCDGNYVSGTIASVSDTPGMPSHVEGGVSYYFSALSTSLPVRHSQQSATNKDGVFVTIELPPGEERYLQVWGYRDESEVGGDLSLLAEVSAPIVADAVVTVSLRPLRE